MNIEHKKAGGIRVEWEDINHAMVITSLLPHSVSLLDAKHMLLCKKQLFLSVYLYQVLLPLRFDISPTYTNKTDL